jgi:putative ATP-dependent endonuclease of OLD family
LHPQLQSVLLRYLSNMQQADGEGPVQVFVTSHSPNFASIAKLDCLSCLFDTDAGIETFFPRQIKFAAGKKEKLERYLDVTRAEFFFARRVIFVEGAAELLLVNVLAEKAGFNLRHHAVSLISVEGLNFDSFMPLFGEASLKVPIAVITDADPVKQAAEDEEPVPLYPAAGEAVAVSANTASMKKLEDKFVKVFYGVKTLEYDLALIPEMRLLLLVALKELHPVIGAKLEAGVAAATTDAEKAKVLFSGMFERSQSNVQKGRYAQALAARIADCPNPLPIPEYIREAVRHACQQKVTS